MDSLEHTFYKKSLISFDLEHRRRIKFNISKYDLAVEKGMSRFVNVKLAKDRASFLKRDVLSNLDSYLVEFEKNISSRGVEVLWAKDSFEATSFIKKILIESDCKLLVKSKSMTTEEIDFNEGAEKIGVESVETDLGEFIVQVAGEKPYHIVTPAMHKSKEDISELFNKVFQTPPNSSPEELTEWVRVRLRQLFVYAEVGVTGANFLVADVGAISMTENEGNGLLSGSFPNTHIVIAGIEKIVPRFEDLDIFLPLLSAHGTGQQLTVYNTLYFGAKGQSEHDGPNRMVVILLDNGRTNLYNTKVHYEALSCIRCGACLNSCPIYKNIGGYTYDTTYSGPIGSVITPHLRGFSKFKHLSFASSLCGKCGEVCPVRISLPELLLENRKLAIEERDDSCFQRFVFKSSSNVLQSRKLMDLIPYRFKNFSLQQISSLVVGKRRMFPKIEQSSFSSQWVDKYK